MSQKVGETEDGRDVVQHEGALDPNMTYEQLIQNINASDSDDEEEFEEEDEAGSESGEGSDAGQDGGQEDGDDDEGEDGDDTDDDNDEGDGDGEGEGDSDDGDDGGDEGDGDEDNAETRIKGLVAEKKKLEERIKALEAKFDESQQPEQDFINIDMDKVEKHVAKLKDEAEELRAGGKILEAAKKEHELGKFLDSIEENENKRKAWEQKKSSGDQEQNVAAELAKKVDEAAEFFQKHNNIPDATWKATTAKFGELIKNDKLFAMEYADRVKVSPIGAIKWAYDLVSADLTKSNDKERKKRETGKKKTVSGHGGSEKKSKPKKGSVELEAAKKSGRIEDFAAAITARTRN